MNYRAALQFVKKMHQGQKRAGGVPSWHHLVRVSETLAHYLNQCAEGDAFDRRAAPIAALGHDVLEDTPAARDEVKRIFGERGFRWIWGMTNEWGDAHHAPYVKKVTQAEEMVRLIKLADLYDNITNVAYFYSELGEKWTRSYFLPIVTPMRKAVARTRFVRYPKTAEHLLCAVELAARLLDGERARFKKKR